MRARPSRLAILAALWTMLGGLLLACFDLFHSTSDIKSACELDAQACVSDSGTDGDAPDDSSGPDAPDAQDFCAWTSAQARAYAAHACAWLGACESPMGRNAFGPCMFQALLAYDCAANPNHGARGEARRLWDCLWQVQSCHDVSACLLPMGGQTCSGSGDYTACGGAAASPNGQVRFECVDGGAPAFGARAENCALWGQSCANGAAAAACAGEGGLACSDKECTGEPRTELLWCVDSVDIGIDCASNGAQRCEGFPDPSNASWLACAAESDAGPCVPDASASCTGGVSWSCPSGVLESIDCARLLQSDAGCRDGPLAPPFDWTSPCVLPTSQCAESCTDAGLIGCARGAAFALDCAAQGLGTCRPVATDMGSEVHPACTPLPP